VIHLWFSERAPRRQTQLKIEEIIFGQESAPCPSEINRAESLIFSGSGQGEKLSFIPIKEGGGGSETTLSETEKNGDLSSLEKKGKGNGG